MMQRHQRTHSSGSGGFTVIEILIALAITAFGFAAIFSLQIGSMQANIAARDLAVGVNLAERYASALRAQGSMTQPLAPPELLQAERGRWHTLTSEPVDHNGLKADASGMQRQRFCVHYWLDLPEGQLSADALNARVRVVWPTANRGVGALAQVCPEAAAANFVERAGDFYAVTLPVLIRQGG